MPTTNFPQGITSFGVPLVGSSDILTSGKVFWVNSATGINASGRGTEPDRPAASIAWAMANLARTGFGDIILVMPGHTETVGVAAAIACSKAGVTIRGFGSGASRPIITWATSTAATITITAADVKWVNCIFNMTGIDAVVTGFVITAANTTFQDCVFNIGDATNQAVLGVTLGAGSDNARFLRCEFYSRTAGATAAIQGVVAQDQLHVENCLFNLDCTAAVRNTTVAWTNAVIVANYFYILGTGKSVIVEATTTGILANNHSFITANIAAGGSVTAAGMFKSQNFTAEAAQVATSAIVDPAATGIA